MGSRESETGEGGAAPLRRLDPERAGDHLDRLFRAAWALCGDRDFAEELVQETYARVFAKPRWLRRDDDLGYLLKSLRNTHISLLRKRAGQAASGAIELDEELTADPRTAGRPPDAAEAQLMFEAIAALPENLRLAVVAVDVAGLSYGEAAKAMRISEASLTSRLHRARLKLAKEWNAGDSDSEKARAETERNRGREASG